MKYKLELQEGGLISKESFLIAWIEEPSEFILDLACQGIFFELWGDAIAVSFDSRADKNLIDKTMNLFGITKEC